MDLQQLYHAQIERRCPKTEGWRIVFHYNVTGHGLKIVAANLILAMIDSEGEIAPTELRITSPSEGDATITDVDDLRKRRDSVLQS